MPNSKQRLTSKKHKNRKERLRRNRIVSMMYAKKSTLKVLLGEGKLPVVVQKARL